MMNFWNQLKPRERLLVGTAGVILIALILYLSVLEPFQNKVKSLEQRVAAQKSDVVWMQQAARELAVLRRQSPGAGNKAQGRSLLVLVDQSAKRNKLGGSLKRVEPDGAARVRVWLERAPFDEVVKWLSELENQYQLQVESAVFDRTDAPGLVNARLVFLGSRA